MDDVLTKSGPSNRKNALGGSGQVAKRAKSRMHLLSFERMQNFESGTAINIQLNKAACEMRKQERERHENCHIDQLHVMSSPHAAPFKVLVEDQQRIVSIEFQ